ncbi:transmembrane protein 268 isoform X1 [Anguilla rostrata]|uniref:transmembrane protein 268 isoform X1 n=2 Tax=Anguilla rostrata TaxID=7938 RepID=UPI0030D43673
MWPHCVQSVQSVQVCGLIVFRVFRVFRSLSKLYAFVLKMEDGATPPNVMDEWDARNAETHPRPLRTQSDRSRVAQRTNGHCMLAVSSSSMLRPSFDLSECRALLEKNGLQVPAEDFETPLQAALDTASVRRYLFFNSAIFHFFLAPLLYTVVWCGLYSTLHLYLSLTSIWVLCLSVSLGSFLLTCAIILLLNHSNRQIDINTDVRLIQANERLIRHDLLVGVADWVHQCAGTLQLFCVYWDLSHCLRSLTDTLEEMSFARDETQSKLRKNMSYLTLVVEASTFDPEAGSVGEEGSEEERPLLVERGSTGRSTPAGHREETKLTKNYSLVPSHYLSAQATAHQLLLTYSATYVRLLVSEKLPREPQRPLHSGMTHCTIGPICLCQYVQRTVLR